MVAAFNYVPKDFHAIMFVGEHVIQEMKFMTYLVNYHAQNDVLQAVTDVNVAALKGVVSA